MKGKITFLTKALTLLIVALFSLTGARAQQTLTVSNSTSNTNSNVPTQIRYWGQYTRSQFIVPASDLTAMNGGLITAVKFYSTTSTTYNSPAVKVYLSEVSSTTFSGNSLLSRGTTVYTGTISLTNKELAITFNTPFAYNGGNLLVEIENTAKGTGASNNISFNGLNTSSSNSYTARWGRNNNSAPTTATSSGRFNPKTTFTYYGKPTALAASNITTTSADLSWTENNRGVDAWEVAYKAEGAANFTVESAKSNPFTLEGLTQDTKYTVKVRPVIDGITAELWSDEITFNTAVAYARPTNVTASDVLATTATISWDGTADSYNLRYATASAGDRFFEDFESGFDAQGWTTIRNGAGTENTDWRAFDPSNFSDPIPAHSGDYIAMSRSWSSSAYSVDNWLISPAVTLGGTMTYWVMDDGQYHEHYDIYVSTTGTNVSDFVKVYEPGDATSSWTEVTVDLSAYAGQTGYVAFRHTDNDQDFLFIDDVTITAPSTVTGSWTTINNVTSPYSLTGLSPETTYVVQVQAVYGGNQSNWASTELTTLSSNPVPFDVTVAAEHTTATIEWTGLGDSYQVQYRTAYDDGATFFEDFEGGLDDWTIYTEDGHIDGYSGWVLMNVDAGGSTAACSFSWYDNAISADNWLISPALDLHGTLKFWAYSQYADEYEVKLSTTGNAISDFTTTLQDMGAASTTGDNISIDLSAYAGQTGYIAIHHVSNDCFYLAIDNFGIYGDATPAGEWVTVTTNNPSVELTGLEMDTEYEYIITSIKDGEPNASTAVATFTTLDANHKIFVTDGDWDVAANWYPVGVPTADCLTAEIQANVTIPAGVVATAQEVIVKSGSITIEDGGQLIHYNEGVVATVEKEISGYGDAVTGGYYLITVPLANGINPADVEGMLEGDYDLYAFDFTQDGQEWRNYKAEAFNLSRRYAYLYANSEDVTLRFTGELMPMVESGYVSFITGNYAAYTTETHPFTNWQLAGNPYVTDAYMTLGDYPSSGLGLAGHQYFYTMNDDGDAIIAGSEEVLAASAEGFFFVSQGEDNILLASNELYAANEATDNPIMVLPFHGLTTNQDASPNYVLANNEDNTAVIEALDGKIANKVTLSDRTLYKDGGWNTICLPFNLTISGSTLDGADVRALNSASVSGSTLTLNFTAEGAVTELTAGTPYIIKWTSGDNIVNPVFNNVTIDKTTHNMSCDLGDDKTVTFMGTYGYTAFTEVDKSILFMGSSNTLYFPGNGAEIGAQRGYFQLDGITITTSQSVNGVKHFVVSFEDDATGITTIDEAEGTTGNIYNIAGQRVSKMQNGIYINNGKKTLVK